MEAYSKEFRRGDKGWGQRCEEPFRAIPAIVTPRRRLACLPFFHPGGQKRPESPLRSGILTPAAVHFAL